METKVLKPEEGIGKRTGIDFSKHEVHVTRHDGFLMHYIKKPNTVSDSIKYINTNGIMAVTGDYGNWIFCREFHPDPKGHVSDGYWEEKLQISSTQKWEDYDAERTQAQIESMINGGLKEYGYTGKKLDEMMEYMENCLRCVDDELDYTYTAYRELPGFCDYESVIFCKKTKYWLLAVFDGFDEICRRMKLELQNNQQ